MTHGIRRSRFVERLGAVGGTSLLLASIMLATVAGFARAADTGPKAPGATTSPNGWTNAGQALAADGADATARGNNIDQGYRDFGFTIPSGSIVDGITVKVKAKSTDSSGCQLTVRISGGGTFRTKTVSLTDAHQVFTLGSATDTWGQVWDRTQLTNSVFRLELRAVDPGSGCNNSDPSDSTGTAAVDYVTVDVTHRTVKNGSANGPLSKGVCNKADFNFIVDMSGSIGAQGSNPSNLPQTAVRHHRLRRCVRRSGRRRPLFRHSLQWDHRRRADERV